MLPIVLAGRVSVAYCACGLSQGSGGFLVVEVGGLVLAGDEAVVHSVREIGGVVVGDLPECGGDGLAADDVQGGGYGDGLVGDGWCALVGLARGQVGELCAGRRSCSKSRIVRRPSVSSRPPLTGVSLSVMPWTAKWYQR